MVSHNFHWRMMGRKLLYAKILYYACAIWQHDENDKKALHVQTKIKQITVQSTEGQGEVNKNGLYYYPGHFYKIGKFY